MLFLNLPTVGERVTFSLGNDPASFLDLQDKIFLPVDMFLCVCLVYARVLIYVYTCEGQRLNFSIFLPLSP